MSKPSRKTETPTDIATVEFSEEAKSTVEDVATEASELLDTIEEIVARLDLPMPTLEYIKLSVPGIDPRVQRAEDPRKLAEMAANFNPAALGILSASRRPNGSLIYLDGQHRSKAGLANDYDVATATNVWEGLTLAQEAALFRLLNNTTKTNAMGLFLVSLSEGNPKSLAIKTVLDKHGVTIGKTPESFWAVAAAQRVVTQSRGVVAFDWAIGVIVDTWGAHKEHLDGRLTEALSMIYLQFGKQIDTAELRLALASQASGVHGLLGKARTIRELRGGRIQTNLADAVLSVYNTGRKSKRLPEYPR